MNELTIVRWNELDQSFWKTPLNQLMATPEGYAKIARRRDKLVKIIYDREYVYYTIGKMVRDMGLTVDLFMDFVRASREQIEKYVQS